MYIETTANIDLGTYRTIKDTAKALRIPARSLVNLLLKIVVKEMPFDYRIYRTVEYQADRPVGDWKCFHLRLTGAVYESGHDMRKLMKYSLSFLLCYAVRVYLEKAVKILREDENLGECQIFCVNSLFKHVKTSPCLQNELQTDLRQQPNL